MIALYRGSNVPTPKLSSCRRQNRRNRRFTFNSPCSPNNRSATKIGGWEERQQQKRETCSYPANPMTIHRSSSFMALPINKYTVEAHNNHFGTCQGILGIIPSQPQWGVFLFYCSKVSRTRRVVVHRRPGRDLSLMGTVMKTGSLISTDRTWLIYTQLVAVL